MLPTRGPQADDPSAERGRQDDPARDEPIKASMPPVATTPTPPAVAITPRVRPSVIQHARGRATARVIGRTPPPRGETAGARPSSRDNATNDRPDAIHGSPR